jgi:hypothetical protein
VLINALVKQLRKEVKELSAALKGLPDADSRLALLSKKHIQLVKCVSCAWGERCPELSTGADVGKQKFITLRQTERPHVSNRQRIATVSVGSLWNVNYL